MSDWVERYHEAQKTKKKGGPGSGHWGHAGRPGERGGSLPGTGLSPGSIVNEVLPRSAANLEKQKEHSWGYSQAKRAGMSREEFDRAANIIAEDLRNHAKITIGMNEGTAIKIGESGEIRGREGGKSGGTLVSGMERREAFDSAMQEDFVFATLGLTEAPYGRLRMIMDKSVLQQATATGGDSLDQVVGRSRLDKGDPAEIREQFAEWAVSAENAHELLAYDLCAYAHPQTVREILQAGRIDYGLRRDLSVVESHMHYVEIQIPTRAVGRIPKSKIVGILYRPLYPGKIFESDRETRRSLRNLFPDIPIRETGQELYALLDYDSFPSLAVD